MYLEVIGWVGAAAVLWAYYLISSGKSSNTGVFYQWLNLIGALLLIVYTVLKHTYASAFVNVVWLVIAAAGLLTRKKEA